MARINRKSINKIRLDEPLSWQIDTNSIIYRFAHANRNNVLEPNVNLFHLNGADELIKTMLLYQTHYEHN